MTAMMFGRGLFQVTSLRKRQDEISGTLASRSLCRPHRGWILGRVCVVWGYRAHARAFRARW